VLMQAHMALLLPSWRNASTLPFAASERTSQIPSMPFAHMPVEGSQLRPTSSCSHTSPLICGSCETRSWCVACFFFMSSSMSVGSELS
jgi:hypothetical protein